jgi:hypothetical protein
VSAFSIKQLLHGRKDLVEVLNRDHPVVFIQNLDKPAHMGALIIPGKIDVHVYLSDGLLRLGRLIKHGYRVSYVLDPNLVYCDVAIILFVLDIFHDVSIPLNVLLRKILSNPLKVNRKIGCSKIVGGVLPIIFLISREEIGYEI